MFLEEGTMAPVLKTRRNLVWLGLVRRHMEKGQRFTPEPRGGVMQNLPWKRDVVKVEREGGI